MDILARLEKTVAGWIKDIPHLPAVGQKWLAQNVWWIVLIGVILSGISFLVNLTGLLNWITVLGTYVGSYYVANSITSIGIVSSLVSLVFIALNITLLGMAINPLRAMVKKGWVLLFAAWLVSVLAVVVNAILSFSVVGVVMGLLFGAIFLAIAGYLLFEIHGQFAHQTKAAKKTQ